MAITFKHTDVSPNTYGRLRDIEIGELVYAQVHLRVGYAIPIIRISREQGLIVHRFEEHFTLIDLMDVLGPDNVLCRSGYKLGWALRSYIHPPFQVEAVPKNAYTIRGHLFKLETGDDHYILLPRGHALQIGPRTTCQLQRLPPKDLRIPLNVRLKYKRPTFIESTYLGA